MHLPKKIHPSQFVFNHTTSIKCFKQNVTPSTYHAHAKLSTTLKHAKICLIFKSGKRDSRSNYHPISILSVLSKILEKHVHIHLYQFLTTYNLLHLAQLGFRKLHSCETALAKLASKFASNMTGIILLDLCKAFDMVDHKVLLKKLSFYKFSNHALRLTETNQHFINTRG